MLNCKNIILEYPDGVNKKTVLNDVTLSINKNENIILLGPSGSGKTSLIYLLSTLKDPTLGEVYFNGINLTAKKKDEKAAIRKNHFAFIFQTHFLIPYLTSIENVMIAKNNYTKASKNKAAEILESLGLKEHLNKKPYKMSGGERQRIATARALFNEPDIIFADEPTDSLDHKTAVEVMKILKSYKKDCTLIMATHDTSILDNTEKVINIADGKLKVV